MKVKDYFLLFSLSLVAVLTIVLIELGGSDQTLLAQSANSTLATVTLPVTQDTYVVEGFATDDNNYGTSTAVVVGRTGKNGIYGIQMLLDFDISTLPANAQITSAELRLFPVFNRRVASVTDISVSAAAISADWNETTVTWNNRPGFTYFNDPPVVLSIPANWISWDVSNLVTTWHSDQQSYHGIRLYSSSGAESHQFESREWGSYEPELVIVYEIPGITPTPTNTLTPTPTLPVTGSCPGTITIYPQADTWIDRANPTVIHGQESSLKLDGTVGGMPQGILLYFPVEQAIPSNFHIYSANLVMKRAIWPYSSSSISTYLGHAHQPFDEATTNANNAPLPEAYSEIRVYEQDIMHTWDALNHARAWHEGTHANNGFYLFKLGVTATPLSYYSRESSTRPYLEIECGTAPPTITHTPTSTPTQTPTPTATATSAPIDYQIDVMEITQGLGLGLIDNSQRAPVTLIATKPTFIQIFVSAQQNGVFIDFPFGAPPVYLTAERNGIQVSPIMMFPVSKSQHLTSDPWNRGNPDDAYLFELPTAWRRDDVTITATVNGINDDPSATDNNTRTMTVSFYDMPNICVVFKRVRTSAGTPNKFYMTDTASGRAMMRRAITLLPVGNLRKFVIGGVTEKLRVNLTYGSYYPNESSDGEKILSSLWWTNLWTDDPDICGETSYAGILKPDNLTVNGLGYRPGDELWFVLRTKPIANTSYSDDFGHTFNINGEYGGRTLAHELGHNYDRKHTDCGDPNNPGYFPYDPCWFAPNILDTYYGFDPSTHAVIEPEYKLGDLMSYTGLRWTSDYTYEKIRSEMVSRSNRAVSQLYHPETGQQTEDVRWVIVSGWVDPAEGTAVLGKTAILTEGTFSAQKLADIQLSTATQPTTYTLSLLNVSGDPLGTYTLLPQAIEDGDSSQQFIGAAVPFLEGAVSVQIQQHDTPLATTTFSSQAPTVHLLAPNGGEQIGNQLTITWEGADADGDTLLYTLQYSPDQGATWVNLTSERVGTSYTIETDSLAGSVNNSLVRVIANDGAHTAFDDSDAPFSLARHAPRVFFTWPENGTVFEEDIPVFLTVDSMDAEDGFLSAGNYQWLVDSEPIASTEETVMLTDLTPGAHVIQVIGTDSDGMKDSDTIVIFITDPIQVFLPMIVR